jgi:Flp pilus assembly protein TadD
MKNNDKQFLLLGFSLMALALCSFAPSAYAQNGDTVSAVGTPDEPRPPEEYPPQPVSVAPAEEATPAVVATPTPVPATTAPPVANAPTQPPEKGLTPGLTPIPGESSDTVTGTNVMGDTGKTKHSGTYYDADALVPDRDMAAAGATGPRKVDPAYEPGQKYVTVQKGPGASSVEAQYIAATRALKLGRYAAAMEMFEKLYKKSHKDPRILMGLAVAQQGAGFNESAAATYEDLLKVSPNNADAIINLMGLMKAQYPSVTLKKLMELRSKYPSNPGVPAQIAQISADQGNLDEAIKYFEIAASMDPRNASHVFNLAIVTDKKGNAPEAIKLYERALQMDATYGDTANELPREKIYDRLVVLRRKV